MGYLRDSDFFNLPEDDAEAFIHLEGISRTRLMENIRGEFSNESYDAIFRYMNEITAVAMELCVGDLYFDPETESYNAEFKRFLMAVDSIIARLRVQRARRDRHGVLELTNAAHGTIQAHLVRLKSEIRATGMAETRKRSLLDKVDDLELDIVERRMAPETVVRFSPAMRVRR